MIIYTHKVRISFEDGWGRSNGPQVEVLGHYSTKEKAIEAKNKREANKELCYCDVGNSWIEEENVK